VLEILVDDNETLKRNNLELQQLLADAREDCRALQEEVEDQCVNPGSVSRGACFFFLFVAGDGRWAAGTPSFSRHYHTGSVPAAMLSPVGGFVFGQVKSFFDLLADVRLQAQPGVKTICVFPHLPFIHVLTHE
jgi:hypothetical protein